MSEFTTSRLLEEARRETLGNAQLVPYLPTAVTPQTKLKNPVVVVRESNRYDLLAFATMVLQTLEALPHVPGVATYLATASTDPALIMRNTTAGDTLRVRFGAQPLLQGTRPYGWCFRIDGTTFVFAMTSAMTSEDEDLANPFTDDLVGILRSVRPSNLFAGPESRLVRRASLGAKLGDVCGLLGTLIHTRLYPGGIDMKVNGWAWTILCRQCEEDLKITVGRLFTGRIYKVRRGQWDRGAGAMLVGYSVDDDGNITLGDDDQQAVARLALTLAARGHDTLEAHTFRVEEVTLTPEAIVARLVAAGAKKRSNKRLDRFGQPIAGAPMTIEHGRATLLTILRDIPAYLTGVLERRQGLPMTGLTSRDIHGLDVWRSTDSPEDKGFTIFRWNLPLPETGWADESTLERAWRYYQFFAGADRRRAPAREAAWPLTGLFTAAHSGRWYRLIHGSGGYQWRHYEESSGYSKKASVPVGKFDAKEVVRRLVEATVHKLEQVGIDPGEVGLEWGAPTPTQREKGDRTTALQVQRAAVEAEYENARAAARDATTDRAREDFTRDTDRLAQQLDELDRKIAAEPAEQVATPAPPEIEIGGLATLFSVLLDTAGSQVDPKVADALARIISQGTVEECWTDDALWGKFRFHLRVRTKHGWRAVGPIEFELGNSSQGPDRKAWERRMARVVELRMAYGAEIEELAPRLGETPSPRRLAKTMAQTVAKIFGVTPNLAAAIVDHPIASTRATLWALHHGLQLPVIEGLTEDEVRRHAEVLAERYVAPRATWEVPAAFLGGERQRREVARFVVAHSVDGLDAGAAILTLAARMGWNTPRDGAARQAKHAGERGGPQAALVEKWAVTGSSDWGFGAIWIQDPATGKSHRALVIPDKDKRLRIRQCPWCKTRTILQPIPCPEGGEDPALCVNCRRTPADPTHVFPPEYLLPWEGPFGRSVTDDRGSRGLGERRGTRLGPNPAMPSRTRLRRVVATQPTDRRRRRRVEPRDDSSSAA